MCLEERELSPICSNELTNIANNTTATTDNNNINATELSNHRNYNNNKTTETGDSVTPTCNQKPYIPGECTVYNSLPMIVKKAAMKDLRRYIFVEAAPAQASGSDTQSVAADQLLVAEFLSLPAFDDFDDRASR